MVLVGGGDPVLSAAPPGRGDLVPGAARISDLADQVRQSGITVTRVQVDNSLFSGPDFAPGWDPADIFGGDIAPIQAVMVDAGRTQPTTDESRRSTTPALDAGRALAGHCGSIRRPSASPRVRRPGSSWLRCSPRRSSSGCGR